MKRLLVIACIPFVAFAVEETFPEVNFIGVEGAPSSSSLLVVNNDFPSPFTNGVAWSDGEIPRKGFTYVAGQTNNANSILWTPKAQKDTVYDMFSRLIIKTGCEFFIRSSSLEATTTFEDLRFEGTPTVSMPDIGRVTLDGKIRVEAGSEVQFHAYKNRDFCVDSDVSGSGTIYFIARAGTDSRKANYSLRGMNDGFVGKIKVSSRSRSNKPLPSLGSNYVTLSITNSIALGGALPEFTYDALHIFNMAVLKIDGNGVILDGESNRGMLIDSRGARINIPDEAGALTVNWPITLKKDCRFYKEGSGRLVLGKPLRFFDSGASVENPTDDGHYIDVTAGSVAVTDCDALNGARIAFSNNTEMVMSVMPPDGDLKRYGVRCDKISAPLATDMPIRLEVPDGVALTELIYTVSLITVKAEDANATASKLSVRLGVDGYILDEILELANEEDGTVTFKASLRETVRYEGLPGEDKKSVKVNINNLRKLENNETSPFDVAEAWSNGKTPYPGPAYVAGTVYDNENSHLWTPYVTKRNEDTVYDMFSTLILKTGCTFWLCHSGSGAAVFNDLRVDGVGAIWTAKTTVTIDGKITIPNGSELQVCAYLGQTFNVDSDVFGCGIVHAKPQGGTDAFSGTYCLNGRNEGFLGKIKVSGRAASTLDKNFSTLCFTNVAALGGNLDQITYDALQLDHLSLLKATGKDIVLLAESNRGILIGDLGSRIHVPEESGMLTVNWPITLKTGRLYKEGLGMLVLGKPLRFFDSGASVENPTGDGHYIDVTAGSVAVTDCNALNGARIAFSNQTELVVHIGAGNEDLKRYGARFDKVSEPFATKVPVRIEAPTGAELTEGVYPVALLTVKREDAEDAKAKLVVSSKVDGYAVKGMDVISDEENVTVTFTANLVKKGFVVTVR